MTRTASIVALLLASSLGAAPAMAADGEVTIIHTGDFHGHLIPRPNMRSDATGNSTEGGVARIYSKIEEIRAEDPHALLLHTGDTIQGSAEVLYTRGQAMVDVLNLFGIDAFAPGNWEFVYGTQRFLELFAGPSPLAPWNAIAANVKAGTDKSGPHVVPPYLIKEVNGVKIGLLGLTTDRGPQVVGRSVTSGLYFLNNANGEVDEEVAKQVAHLRNVEKVDLLVMMSEMGLANNIRIVEKIPGIDVVLSSDMHEETKDAVVAYNGETGQPTILLEQGQDGTMMSKLKLRIQNGQVKNWNVKAYNVNDDIPEHPMIAAKVAEVRKTFVSGPDFVQHVNPFNGSKLKRPIDTVVGYTTKALHRSNFSHEHMPAQIEGSSHDFLTDAFRAVSGADIGAIRGFRYGTHVAPGPIKQEDLYHYMPIGPQIAVGTIRGAQLKNQIENAANGSLNPDVSRWTGGWLFNFSGVTMDMDPYAGAGNRASNIRVNGEPFSPASSYTYASYWYAVDPCFINVVPIDNCTVVDGMPSNITILRDDDGEPLDGTEVVVKYLSSLPGQTADTQLDRIRLVSPLPAARFGFPEVQPLRGAQP